jgi:beta-glucanase (GH16 family)
MKKEKKKEQKEKKKKKTMETFRNSNDDVISIVKKISTRQSSNIKKSHQR